jgi:hypothetical protein
MVQEVFTPQSLRRKEPCVEGSYEGTGPPARPPTGEDPLRDLRARVAELERFLERGAITESEYREVRDVYGVGSDGGPELDAGDEGRRR